MHYVPLNAFWASKISNGSGGFTSPPAPPPPIATIMPVPSPRVMIPVSDLFIPPDAFRYTVEQLLQMRAAADELTAAQYSENGDGLDFDLEQIAAEENATDAAVDAGFDTTLPVTKKEPNVMPLILAAVAAYFFL